MPTETFLKLSEEKKSKIIYAGKKEFSRVPFAETSIKNIVEAAGIARGSFYQYFESKEDLLKYIMKDAMDQLEDFVRVRLKEDKGDIFQVYIDMYDYTLEHLLKKEDIEFHKRIFENMRAMDESSLASDIPKGEIKGPFRKTEFLDQIDRSKLKVQNDEELRTVIKMLFLVIRKGLASNFKYNSPIEARNEFIRMIEFLRKGIEK